MAPSLLVLLLGCTSASAAAWTRGKYGTLTFAADGQSYSYSYGSTVFKSEPGSLANATAVSSHGHTSPDAHHA